MIASVERLYSSLGYAFSDKELLESALTHCSVGSINNERLEFLGDAILGFVIAEQLYLDFTQANEGQLSRMRAGLVKKETLAETARSLDLGKYLHLGSGELRTGGHSRDSILADALEAVIAAIYLDSGFTAAQQVILRLFVERFNSLSLESQQKDAKTQLQEFLQADKRPLPDYQIIEISGDPHNQQFQVICTLSDTSASTTGAGSSRRRAEQDAADRMLLQLLQHD